MAGDWIKIDCNTPDKPEVLLIARHLGINDPDLVVGKLLRVWAWFDQHFEDAAAACNGHVTPEIIDQITRQPNFGAAMLVAGWLREVETGKFEIPNFARHNGNTAKRRVLTAERVGAFRKRKSNGSDVTPALPRVRVREREVNTHTAGNGQPKARQAREIAKRVLDHLNAKAGTKFEPGEENIKLIATRVLTGASEDTLRGVIDAKCAEWLADADMRKFLRPSTLFNATKFSQYAGQLGAEPPAPPQVAPRSLVAVLSRAEGGSPTQCVTYFANVEGFDFEREARRSLRAHARFLREAKYVVIEFEGGRQEFDIARLANDGPSQG